ncbi:MAG: hypothetical protein K9J30_13610 [Bacteroidales bacterium]|nr:hypothetical protein [Bacteroidales bacterium]
MSKILGLDLGSNSLGWAIVDDEAQTIIDSGVRIFPEGVENLGDGEREKSRNAQRREHRQTRRQFFRKRLRKTHLLRLLIDQGMCPLSHDALDRYAKWHKDEKKEGRKFPDSEEFVAWLRMNPYALRKKALDDSLTHHEMGRVLYHMIMRRGFLSGRKSKEEGKIYTGKEHMAGIDETVVHMSGKKTLGEYLHSVVPKEGEPYRHRVDDKGRPVRARARYTLRDMYVEEFDRIWNRQAPLLGLDKVTLNWKKQVHLKGDPENQRNRKRVENLQKLYGEDKVHQEGKEIFVKREMNLKQYLAGDIWYENGKVKFDSNESVLFWQRPLRSQKNLLQKCRFEGKKYYDKHNQKWVESGPTPCHISHPEFEEFRAHQFVNTIRFGHGQKLDDAQRDIVLKLINSKSRDFDFSQIPKKLKMPAEKLNYEDRFKVKGNPTHALVAPLFTPEVWNENKEEIWHCFHFFEDTDRMITKLVRDYGLDEKKKEKAMKVRLDDDYASVSLKAIRNINPFLKEGFMYNEAVILGGVKNAFGSRWDYYREAHGQIIKDVLHIIHAKNKEGEAIEKIRAYLYNPLNQYGFTTDDKAFRKLYHHSQEVEEKTKRTQLSEIENLRNPAVQIGLNETRRLVNLLLEKHRQAEPGFSFDKVHVELSRDLRNNKKLRQEINQRIKENRKKNDEARERLKEFGLRPGRENITKYRLYQEIWETYGQVVCPYTNKNISLKDLLGEENRFQIEHIIPYSISLDDSFGNKTLCESNFNREKGELTPYQFHEKDPDPVKWGAGNWAEVQNRAFRLLPYTKARKFCAKKTFEKDTFIQRQLNDNRYISKKAAEIFTEICESVRVMPGSLTSELRHLWGLNNILQPVEVLELKGYQFDENKRLHHWVIQGKDGKAKKIVSVQNEPPFPSKNEIVLPGYIDKMGAFKAKTSSFPLTDNTLIPGKYWCTFQVGPPEAFIPYYNEKPVSSGGTLVLKGMVKDGQFHHDSLKKKTPVDLPEGTYWASFRVPSLRLELPEKKKQPSLKANEIAFFGEVREGTFYSYLYDGPTDETEGKYWGILTLEENPVFIRVRNEKPVTGEDEVVLQGMVDEKGILKLQEDLHYERPINATPGHYWVVYRIDRNHVAFYPENNEKPEVQQDELLLEGDVWVDKQTGEIRFDPKKNREDQRHHAIDAITIAFTKTAYLQKLSHYNAHRSDYKRGIDDKPVFPLPWENFDRDVKKSVDRILVSYRQNDPVVTQISKTIQKAGKTYQAKGLAARGQLHREFYFGKHPRQMANGMFEKDRDGNNVYYYHLRKSVTTIKTHKHVNKIADAGIRQLIECRLREEYGVDTVGAYSLPDNFFFSKEGDPLLQLPNRRGEPVPVKKVRMREYIGNAEQLHEAVNRHVNPYNNHHIVIYEDEKGELKEEVISFWKAVERCLQGEPLYQLPPDGAKMITTLQENDMFLIGYPPFQAGETVSTLERNEALPYLYRVQKLSSMYYTFRFHLASTIDNEGEEISVRSFNSWKKLIPVKVDIVTTGEIKTR